MPYKLIPPKAGRWSSYRVRGTEFGIYIDRSTSTGDRREAQQRLNQWREEARRATGPLKVGTTFEAASLAYMEAGGERRFLAPLLTHFAGVMIDAIDQQAIDAAASALYPKAGAATRNRQVYSPVIAVLRRSGVATAFKRPIGGLGRRRLQWLKPEEAARLLSAAGGVEPRFGALCAFLLYTGCRLSEALELARADLPLDEGFAYIRDTKNGDPRPVHLPPQVIAALRSIATEGTARRRRVFGWSKCGLVYGMLGEACKKAKIKLPARTAFHIFRHTYGAWMRRYAGLDTSGLVATGAWKSRNAASIYEHAVTTEEARKADLLPGGGEAPKKRRAG